MGRSFNLAPLGSGCSTAVEHTSHEDEVSDSIPARDWAFFMFYLLSSESILGPSRRYIATYFLLKCLAVQSEANQA